MQLTGSEIIIECLKEQGVDTVFGYPGGTILNVYDALYKHSDEITHILTSHEQGAAHAADGYARATGKVGVCMATSGPGATNLVTGIATAYMDSIPIVAITANVAVSLLGKDTFQEVDIAGITMPITKHNYIVKDVTKLADTIRSAFRIAKEGRPGPVLVDITKDVTANKTEYTKVIPEPIRPVTKNMKEEDLEKAVDMIKKSQKPFVFVGGGAIASGASKELREFVHKINAPVTDTLMGKGAFNGEDPLYSGMLGMHGTFWANHAVSNCDVLFAVGTRFNDRITGCLKRFCKDAKVIHVDIDPCSISKNVPVDTPIVGDAKKVLNLMLNEYNTGKYSYDMDERRAWISQVNEWKHNKAMKAVKDGIMSPQDVIEAIYNKTKDKDAIIATEVGQHQMWTAQLYKFSKPRQLVTSGGLGTMGFGFPAAIGAQIAAPDKLVFNIAGDGSIQMNIQELMTCVDYKIPVKIAVINNGYLGMVRQWQEKMFNKHYSQTPITSPDYVKLAEAYGILGIRVTKEEEINSALDKAIAYNGPVIIDFVVEPFEMVYPWVLAGKPLDEVLLSNETGLGE